MRRNLNDLVGYTIRANDGDIGTVHEFYIDDQDWTVRYLVVDTGAPAGRKVLISPVALGIPDWESRTLPVNLTKEQTLNSPGIDTDKPVSRQNETELHGYYGWPVYWSGGSVFAPASDGGITYRISDGSGGMIQTAPSLITEMEAAEGEETPPEEPESDIHLRSTCQVTGNRIEATDGEIGHVESFIVDDETWQIRYFLVDTRNWLPGKKVLVSPRWIDRVSWDESRVYADMTRDAIRNSPEYDPQTPVTPNYEGELHDYYGRPLD